MPPTVHHILSTIIYSSCYKRIVCNGPNLSFSADGVQRYNKDEIKFKIIKMHGNFQLEKTSLIKNFHFHELLRGMQRRREMRAFLKTSRSRGLSPSINVLVGRFLNLYTYNFIKKL
jgi:hypothetical protein